jgi:hypothetical protein
LDIDGVLAGQVLISKDQMTTLAMIPVTGEIEACLGGGSKVALHPYNSLAARPRSVIQLEFHLLRKFLAPATTALEDPGGHKQRAGE